jgi:hypothetical protein
MPTVTITDLDSGGAPLGNATLTIPAGGATGSMTTSNIQMDFAPLDGTAVAGSGGATLVDDPPDLPPRDFGQLGVAPGDWVENISDCSQGRVASVGPVAGQLTVVSLQGGTNNTFAAGDVYRIHHELPPWFVRNNWHQLVYAAASSELVPGQPGICTPGTNCLTVNDGMTAATNNDNKQAIVISAGDSLAAIAQNRIMARIQDYYENENVATVPPPFPWPPPPPPPDVTFERSAFPPLWDQFNDQLRIVAP